MDGIAWPMLSWPVVAGIVFLNVFIDSSGAGLIRDSSSGQVKGLVASVSALSAASLGAAAGYLPQDEDSQLYVLVAMGVLSGPAINFIVEKVSSVAESLVGGKAKEEAKED
ncbi:hypothetical protein H257_15673 [Aphanomyces astaci]|uniref:Holin n=1 Tax=Aphanomyces astaci TaxID=112090 RepID=W4FLE9_APHAT|nr:hypothetical protein H257_15673 [Aphanomyces astaci]ETV68352.1 hypothetical protein H257_15673 [Aphanomyces astaci]RQM22635.1 hypothetical protein B5M09_005500 [Aphanomyces astaci]|eukprot:XP_009842147.1 hypothetical protein H257_15673 [Aphanomyces astaci]